MARRVVNRVNKMKKRWPSLVLGLAVSLIALAYLLRRDLGGVRDELLHARYWVILPCLLLSAAGLWLRGMRWRVLLNNRLSVKDSFHMMNVGYFMNAVLPLRIGEVGRAFLATRADPPVRVLTSLSTILVERLIDTLAVFVLIGLILAILPVGVEIGIAGMLLGVGAVTGMIVLSIFAAKPAWAHTLLDGVGRVIPFLRRPRFHEWTDHLLDGIAPLRSMRAMLLMVGWTALAWATSVATGFVLLYAIFDEPTWVASMSMIAFASFAVAVPAVPGNLGPFEAAVVFGLASADLVAHATDAPAVAFALLLHLFNVGLYILFGLAGLWAEGVNLGEVMNAAQALRARGQEPLPGVEPPA